MFILTLSHPPSWPAFLQPLALMISARLWLRHKTSKRGLISKPSSRICQENEVKHSKWNQVTLPLMKWIIVIYKQNWLDVSEGIWLRDALLKKCHDGPFADHGGAKCTRTFFKKSYYWHNLEDNVEEYVKTCLIC